MEHLPLPCEDFPEEVSVDECPPIQEARVWSDNYWTARVIKNEDDEGWAVAMLRDGEQEPALVGPWTMGRDKKNPKPLDANAFNTLVKAASEVIRRHEQQRHAMLHKSVYVTANATTTKVMLDITPDEDNPSALLSAFDESGNQLAQVRVEPSFKLSAISAAAWIEADFRSPN
jgi:maltose-binding protein MalE